MYISLFHLIIFFYAEKFIFYVGVFFILQKKCEKYDLDPFAMAISVWYTLRHYKEGAEATFHVVADKTLLPLVYYSLAYLISVFYL